MSMEVGESKSNGIDSYSNKFDDDDKSTSSWLLSLLLEQQEHEHALNEMTTTTPPPPPPPAAKSSIIATDHFGDDTVHGFGTPYAHTHNTQNHALPSTTRLDVVTLGCGERNRNINNAKNINTQDKIDDNITRQLPVGTCWICIQAATDVAEKRNEEDRQLAASLSAIILDGDVDYNNNNNNNNNKGGEEDSQFQDEHNRVVVPDTTTASAPPPASVSDDIREILPKERLLEEKIEGHQHQHNHHQQGNDHQNKNKNIDNDNDGTVYIGEYNLLGQRHGSHGELIWDDKSRYVGSFRNGMRSGQGTFFFQNGSEYTGDWKDNQMHGHGQRKYLNGDVYVGQYRYGQRWGGPKGKMKFSCGDLYVGAWESDQFHGSGRYFFKNGTVLEGNFVHGTKSGKFKRQLPQKNELDIIRYENDQIVGQACRWNGKRNKTWLLKIEAIPNRNSQSRVRLGKFRRRHRHRNTSQSSNDDGVEDCNNNPVTISPHSSLSSSAPSSMLLTPMDNIAPVVPQEITSKIKKSIRIPISQAVSIGYDCEMGTGSIAVSSSESQDN